MRFFAFDTLVLTPELVPLAARRALDVAGWRLSRVGWANLGHSLQAELVSLGGAHEIDRERVAACLAAVAPPAVPIEACLEPSPALVPDVVQRAYREVGAITPAVWSALSALERYVLWKVATRAGDEARDDQDSTARVERARAAYTEIVGFSQISTHLQPSGGVRMVDIGTKAESRRRAVAASAVTMSAAAFDALRRQEVPKGDVLGTARLAGIMAAKRTAEWIPLCHPIPLTHVSLQLTMDSAATCVFIEATAETVGKTGVEMEALVAASCAALTVYDMLKSLDRGMVIGPTRLISKAGGASGDFSA